MNAIVILNVLTIGRASSTSVSILAQMEFLVEREHYALQLDTEQFASVRVVGVEIHHQSASNVSVCLWPPHCLCLNFIRFSH